MTDDLTGEPLIQRSDDNVETLRKRLTTYHQVRSRPSTLYLTQAISYLTSSLMSRSCHSFPGTSAANRPRRRLLPQDRYLGWY